MTQTQAETLAATYFDAWLAKDFARLRTVFAEDVTFDGPFAKIAGVDECMQGLEGLSNITTAIEIRKVFVSGDDVLTWYDFSTSVADTVPVANWMHVEDGNIARIEVAFDARGLASAS
ncbi:MAG TPA: nuclear transport factor 2 family protein [Streptosporangiaceae bacterium]